MRIVAGRHRGRRLRAPAGRAVRPTAGRVRQALFDLLAHGLDWHGIAGAHVADLFCGSGAVALEALSRGAARATLIDDAAPALAAARRNVAALGEEGRATLLKADATGPLPPPWRAADLVYLDPPWRLETAAADALARLTAGGWLAPGAVAAVELAQGAAFTPPPGFVALDRRRWGRSQLLFLRAGEAAGACPPPLPAARRRG